MVIDEVRSSEVQGSPGSLAVLLHAADNREVRPRVMHRWIQNKDSSFVMDLTL